jgi:hypothetical protein
VQYIYINHYRTENLLADIFKYLLSDLELENTEKVEYCEYCSSDFGSKMKFKEIKISFDNYDRAFLQVNRESRTNGYSSTILVKFKMSK